MTSRALFMSVASIVVAGVATAAQAAPVFSEDFDHGVTGWTSSNGLVWGNQSWGQVTHRGGGEGNMAAGTTGDGLSEYTHSLGTAVTQSWELTFDWGWNWGDGSNVGTGVALRTGASNGWGYEGYAFLIYQGDQADAQRFQIRKYTATDANGWVWATIASGSDGTTEIGSTNDTVYDYKHAKLTWDAATNTLTAYYRLDSSAAWIQVAQVVDTRATSFSDVVLLTQANGGADARIDNLSVSTVPEPAAACIAGVGSLLLLSRRKTPLWLV